MVRKRETSEFRTQFACLTKIDIQFPSLSEFDIEHTNFFSLSVSHPFSSISLFLIFFLNTGPWERRECPYLILKGMDRSETLPCRPLAVLLYLARPVPRSLVMCSPTSSLAASSSPTAGAPDHYWNTNGVQVRSKRAQILRAQRAQTIWTLTGT